MIGRDALAESVCRDLRADGSHVTLISDFNPGLRERVEAGGAAFVAGSARDTGVLRTAGVGDARAVLILDQDDNVNLEVALDAREVNPSVRIVMRQFNRGRARKVEQNLRDCSVLSLAAHSAATYAAAAIDPGCFLGVEFPTGSHSLVGFSRHSAAEAGVSGLAVAEAAARLQCRVLSLNGRPPDDREVTNPADELILFGTVGELGRITAPLQTAWHFFRWINARVQAIRSEVDPLLRVLLVVGVCVFLAATVFFSFALDLQPLTAAYFVTTTMTTVGYGDIALKSAGPLVQLAGMGLMVAGLVIANLAIAFVAAALIRAQWNVLQGLRTIRDAGHIVVFGAGRVGTRIVDFLCKQGASVTVVELNPAPALIARARAGNINLLTGDGSLDETLDIANVRAARSAVVVTDNDATNLEIGLGARALRGDIPVIMRIAEPRFAAAIRTQFGIRRTFSGTALASSAFSDLARSPAARGRVALQGTTFRLQQHHAAHADRRGFPLAAAAGEAPARAVSGWPEVMPDDVVLVMVPNDIAPT